MRPKKVDLLNDVTKTELEVAAKKKKSKFVETKEGEN